MLGQPVGHQRARCEDTVGTSVIAAFERGQFRPWCFGVDALRIAEEDNRIARAVYDEQWTANMLSDADKRHRLRALPSLGLVRRS